MKALCVPSKIFHGRKEKGFQIGLLLGLIRQKRVTAFEVRAQKWRRKWITVKIVVDVVDHDDAAVWQVVTPI